MNDYHLGGFETSDRRFMTEKKEYIDPHHLTYSGGNPMFSADKSLNS